MAKKKNVKTEAKKFCLTNSILRKTINKVKVRKNLLKY